jgi:hypothetical protein
MYEFETMLGISAISILIYGWFFQIKWWKLVFGIPPFIAAFFLESYITNMQNYIFIVLIMAPIIEESLKFLSTIVKRTIDTGIAVGLMFALIENAMYFRAYGFIFLTIFLVREFTDPILHSTTTGIATYAWKKKYLGIPLVIAILMHMGWNEIGYLTIRNPDMIYIPAIIYGIILYSILMVRKKNKKPDVSIIPK